MKHAIFDWCLLSIDSSISFVRSHVSLWVMFFSFFLSFEAVDHFQSHPLKWKQKYIENEISIAAIRRSNLLIMNWPKWVDNFLYNVFVHYFIPIWCPLLLARHILDLFHCVQIHWKAGAFNFPKRKIKTYFQVVKCVRGGRSPRLHINSVQQIFENNKDNLSVATV